MSKFKVGERVAMYNHNGKQIVKITCNESNHDGVIMVEVRPEICVAVHEKQLRKLKKRRVIWIHTEALDAYLENSGERPSINNCGPTLNTEYAKRFTKFIEVKEK